MHFLPPVSPQNRTIESIKEEAFEKMKEYYLRKEI
jgi:ribosomal protein L19